MSRKAWELNPERYAFTGRRVLVTGAAGVVGQEVVRQLLAEHRPALVRLFDQNESGLFFAEQTLRAALPESADRLRLLMGDVRDRDRLIRAFQNIDVVIHCAALKSPWLYVFEDKVLGDAALHLAKPVDARIDGAAHDGRLEVSADDVERCE